MTSILLVTSSPRGPEGLSTRFATEIAEGLKAVLGGTLSTRDLAANPPPHIAQAYIGGRVAAPEARSPEQAKMRLRKPPVPPAWKPLYAASTVRIESWSRFLSEAYWNVTLDE